MKADMLTANNKKEVFSYYTHFAKHWTTIWKRKCRTLWFYLCSRYLQNCVLFSATFFKKSSVHYSSTGKVIKKRICGITLSKTAVMYGPRSKRYVFPIIVKMSIIFRALFFCSCVKAAIKFFSKIGANVFSGKDIFIVLCDIVSEL